MLFLWLLVYEFSSSFALLNNNSFFGGGWGLDVCLCGDACLCYT